MLVLPSANTSDDEPALRRTTSTKAREPVPAAWSLRITQTPRPRSVLTGALLGAVIFLVGAPSSPVTESVPTVGGPAEAYAPCSVLAANAAYWTAEHEWWHVNDPYDPRHIDAYDAMAEAIADYMWHCSG